MKEPDTFYEVMLSLERQHPQAPEIGKACSPKLEPYRFGVFPSLGFATADVTKPDPSLIKKRAGHFYPVYYFNNFGLLGPNGALPIHLTEYALQRIRHHDDHAWVEFLDLFHHRFFTLLYRTWADGKPTANQTSEKRPFFQRLFDLLGSRDLDIAPFQQQHRKHQEGIERGLSHSLGMPVRLKPFQGQWLHISLNNQTQVGRSRSSLGQTTILGRRVWDVHSKVHIVLGPMSWRQFESLQTGQSGLAFFKDKVANLLGIEYDWDYTCIIDKEEIPDPVLNGRNQLGRNLWLSKNHLSKCVQVKRKGLFIQH